MSTGDLPEGSQFVEITVRFLGHDYRSTRDVYMQRVNYDWVMMHRPNMIPQIIAVVNDLQCPVLVHMEATK